MRFAKWLPLLLLVVLTACKSSQVANDPSNLPVDEFALLHLNDVYEIAPLQGGKVGGLARVATLKQQVEAEGSPLFTFMAGDFLSPSVIGTVKWKGNRILGAQVVDVMNAVGFDFVVFGNHEFDLGQEELQARIDSSRFDWIAGNVRQADPDQPQPFQQLGIDLPVSQVLVVSRDNLPPLRVGVISLCLPANQRDYVHYQDVEQSALAQWQDLLPRSDFIVAVTHQTIEQDRALAQLLPGLKLIMGGHEHDHHYEEVNGVPIAKADANAKTAYVHRFHFYRLQGQVQVRSELVRIDSSLLPDPKVAQKVAAWEARAYTAFEEQGLDLDQPVVTLAEPLDGLESHIRNQQTNLGLALAQAMYRAWDSIDCAMINSGAVRLDDYLQGEITQFDLVRALPFGGQVLRVDLKGSLLNQIPAASQANRGSGGYLQLYRLQPSDQGWLLAGQPIAPQAVYSVAISDFLLTGLEKNLGFLTPENPGVVDIHYPDSLRMAKDIRLALVEYLKNR